MHRKKFLPQKTKTKKPSEINLQVPLQLYSGRRRSECGGQVFRSDSLTVITCRVGLTPSRGPLFLCSPCASGVVVREAALRGRV